MKCNAVWNIESQGPKLGEITVRKLGRRVTNGEPRSRISTRTIRLIRHKMHLLLLQLCLDATITFITLNTSAIFTHLLVRNITLIPKRPTIIRIRLKIHTQIHKRRIPRRTQIHTHPHRTSRRSSIISRIPKRTIQPNLSTIRGIHENIHTFSRGGHTEARLTDHLTVRGRVGRSGGDDCVAGVVETGPHGVVDGVGTGPSCRVEERTKVAAGGETDGIGVTGPNAVVGGWGVICGDVESFEVCEIGLAAHVGLGDFNGPEFQTMVTISASLKLASLRWKEVPLDCTHSWRQC